MRPRPSDSPAVRAGSGRDWLWGAALVGAIFLAYAMALRGEFLWDDDLHVTLNPTIIGPLGLKEIWTTAAANYFPLVLTNFWVQHALWGLNPVGYHIVTLACHALAAVLLWRVLVRLSVPGAWLGAALWALHPVQVESVAWICELKNTQSAVFFLAAIWCWVRWVGDEGAGKGEADSRLAGARRYWWAALGCAVLAILSKPSTVMLPVALALCTWWVRRRLTGRDLWALAPFFALSALAAGWAIWEQKYHSGAVGAEWNQTAAERALLAGRVGWFYLGKLLWPVPLIFIYPRWTLDAGDLLGWLPLVAALAGGAWLGVKREQWRGLFFAAGFFVALLFPVLGFFSVYFFRYSFVGDHFQYLASMGPLVWIAAAVTGRWSRALPWVKGAAVAMLVGLTAVQCGDYRNQETLWRATTERNPDSAMAWAQLGAVHARAGRADEAMAGFQRALKLEPRHPEALNHLGCQYLIAGKVEQAVAELEKAVAARPAFGEAHSNLGVALLQAGRAAEALPHFEVALKSGPDPVQARCKLGEALSALGRWDEALAQFSEAARWRSDDPVVQTGWGLALTGAGRPAEAVPHFEAALRVRANDADTHEGLAQAMQDLGRTTEALGHLEQALRLAPGRAKIHDSYALVLAAAGRMGEAVAEYERALQLQPGLGSAHNGLGVIYAQAGRLPEALGQFEAAVRSDANDAKAQLNRGGALAALNRLPEAREALLRAVQLQPDSSRAQGYLARVLQAMGRDGEAREHAERAAQLQRAGR